MKSIRRILDRLITGIFTLSGAMAGIVIVLIVLFLFKEGVGLFGSPAVENGYVLCVHSSNPAQRLTPHQIKQVFDAEITSWQEVGGSAVPIRPFRFDEIFNLYSEDQLGEDYSLLPQRLGEVIASDSAIIAFVPQKYLPQEASSFKVLENENIRITDFFGGREWLPTAVPAAQYGVLPLIAGTLLVSLVAILIALPLGLGAAAYLSELAGNRVRGILKPAIELLAGIPSVVYGFWGLVVLVPFIQRVFNLPVGETAFAGSVVLAIMALPTIITVAEDAMRNVPRSMREASLALGATRWQTLYKVVVPYAKSGITAAVVLGIGRAVGETMAVLMVTGNAAVMPTSLFEPVRTIPATIAAELGETSAGSSHYQALFLLGCILFVITMLISLSAEMVSKQSKRSGL